jgi:hypothetical protein
VWLVARVSVTSFAGADRLPANLPRMAGDEANFHDMARPARRHVVRKLVLTVSAALAAVLVIGLGDGAIAAWFRAVGGGAAVGFALSVLWHAKATDKNLGEVSERFGPIALIVICLLGAAGGIINDVAARHRTSQRLSHAARADVLDFISGQGFWAGQPVVRDSAVNEFGAALRHDGRPVPPTQPQRVLGVTYAVTRAPSENEGPLTVEGVVCSRYALVPNALTRSFGFTYVYRLVSPGGRDEIHVVSGGGYTTIARGLMVRVTGLLAATGPRRDNESRNTAFLLGLTSGKPLRPRSSPKTDQLCADTT